MHIDLYSNTWGPLRDPSLHHLSLLMTDKELKYDQIRGMRTGETPLPPHAINSHKTWGTLQYRK
jgi:hypothetical protein